MFLCFISLFAIFKVSADEPAEPTPYQIEFENGNKIFYMYPTGIADDDSCLNSGLYYNTEPPENIYLINSYVHTSKYFYEGNLIFSNDGIYFANMPWTSSEKSSYPDGKLIGTALAFYEKGRMLRQYNVSQLIEKDESLTFSASHVYWEKYEEREFDSENNILAVTTNDDIVYKFDLTTGNIVDKKNIGLPDYKPGSAIIIIGIITICMLILLFAHISGFAL